MNLEIRKDRDYTKPVTFKSLWLKEQFARLRKVYDPGEVSNEELKNLLLSEYDKRRLVKGRLYSNMTQKNEVMTQEQFIDYFLNKPYILSGYATFYEDQSHSVNIGSSALKFLLDSRKVYKKKMEESEYGSDEYVYYKILQSTFKVLANSYYGILGEKNSVFYNPHVQNSITMTGQDLITTAIVTIENFLADNVKLNDADDLIRFITDTLSEKVDDQIMKYLDEPVTNSELLEYLKSKVSSEIPEAVAKKIESMVSRLTVEESNRLYYKNKTIEFMRDSSYLRRELSEILRYEYTEKPAAEVKDRLAAFNKAIMTFCFSDMVFEDRFKRALKDDRKNVVVSDTDSAFINLDNYISGITKVLSLDPKDSAQQMSITNVLISIVTGGLEKIFWKVTGNMGLLDQYKPIISMKNEFLFKKLLLTRNKKSYAGLITAELGKLLGRSQLDMKGLSIRKSSVAKTLRKQFTSILLEDVLSAESVDLRKIINKFDDLGLQIENSLKAGEITYTLPKNVEQIDGYKDPSMQEPVRGVLVWNALEPEQPIVPPEKVNTVKLKAFDKDSPELKKLAETHPDKYATIMRVVFNEGSDKPKIDISRFGLSIVAIPKSASKIPDYLIPLIDLQSMVSNNMTNGYIILESLGIYVGDFKQTKYKSNITEI